MKLHCLRRIQYLPISIDTAWRFFSNPVNLAKITPSWLNFKLVQAVPENTHAGMIISYQLTPLPFMPVNWVTEITHVRHPYFFVDEQRLGPYKFWHHQHVFKPSGDGIEMTDIVHYALGYGILGDLIHRFIVAPRLENIFDYRYDTLTRLFSTVQGREGKTVHPSRKMTFPGSQR